MAEAYAFSLLVELEGNPNIPKLKNKLVKYFQSKKSNGGDCLVEYEDGQEAVVRFKTEEVRHRVLEKQEHEIRLDRGVLKLTIGLPSDDVPRSAQETQSPITSAATDSKDLPKSGDGDGHTPLTEPQTEMEIEPMEVEDKLVSTSAVLGNIEESMNKEFLEMLIENILSAYNTSGSDSPTATQTFSVEILTPVLDTGLAVVTFQNGKETENFITSCTSNRMFRQKQLSVKLLELTTKVKVENINPNVSSDHLQLLFGKGGEEVEDAEMNEEDQSAILTFQDPKAVHRVLEKPHYIEKQPLKAFPFYDSLGTALYGKDRPTLKLPSAFTENINQAIWRYLCDNQEAAETIHKEMTKNFCNVDFQQPTIKLSPLPSLLKQKGVKPKHLQQWKDTTKVALIQALSNFKSLELQVQGTAWEESEGEILKAVSGEAVMLVREETRGVLAVVGLVEDVDRLRQTLDGIMDRISRRIKREKASITEEFPLVPSIYQVLLHGGLLDKIVGEFPDLKLTYNQESQSVTIYGLLQEVLCANRKLAGEVVALKQKLVELDDYVLEFLQEENQEKLSSSLLTLQSINAALKIERKGVQLLAVSEEALCEAEHQLHTLLISQYIDVEDSDLLRMSEWKDIANRLEEASNTPFRKVMVQTSGAYSGQQVVVSGYKEKVLLVRNELDDFLHQNAHVDETIEVKPEAIGKFIQEQHRDAWSDKVRDSGVKVSFKDEAIYLSGTRVHVTDCKELFENLVSSTFFDALKISKPGAKKFFQDNEPMYVDTVMNQTGCVVQLIEEEYDANGGQGIKLAGGGMKPTYQLQTPDGVEIAVCKADMCKYSADAVVNAAALDLKHNGGLAGALLDTVGPQLQDECNQIIKNKGQLKPGDSVITSAGGKLRCKHIIHAVGPRFDQANPQKAMGQLRRAVKGSLDLAETHNCLYVALPAISSGNLGFPLTLCADTIVKAVKEYCDDKFGYNTLKKIHLVNNDDKTVQAMEAAVLKVFGSHGTSHPRENRPTIATHRQPGNRVQRTSGSSVQTKEGLAITLTKGNIQDAVTEVVVNTVGEDLALNHGAVSKAILTAAGPQLQTLVNQQGTAGRAGEVIVTTGCNLKSKRVFHTIAPHWDNGQGAPQKILSGIVKECLSEAEHQGLISITFPAIGTGNLGFPKDLVASLMLEEVLKFSSKKNPKHLKEVVFILHPGDASTIQAFTDEFNKGFTTQSGTSRGSAASSQQSKGPFSKITSNSGMHETKMGGVLIQVITGDITKETTDVIVNSSNNTFSLQTGVSKAILDAAGQIVVAECQQLGAQPNNGVILTQPGNMRCKKIIHMVGQTDPKKIQESVKGALQMCAQNNLTSISFPAIGTGQGNVQAGQVADAMLDAVVEVVGQKSQNTLQLVRMVIFQPAMLTEFHKSMVKKEDTDVDTQKKGSIWGKLKSLLTWGKADMPQKDKDFVIEGQPADPAFFHICGGSQARVDQAKRWIKDLILKEQVSNSITDDAILNLSDSDRKCIHEMQTTMGVSVRIEYNSSREEAMLTVEGLSKDVLNAVNEIQEMLRKARDKETFNRNVEVASNMVEWQYQQQPGGQYQSFDPIPNFHLEQALERKLPHIAVSFQGQMYKVTLPDGPATDTHNNSLKIRRIDKFAAQPIDSLPQHWDAMPANTSCHSCLIQPGSPEHNEVLNLFQATCGNIVLKIERIQNPSLWRNLQIKKDEMELRNGHKNNEKRLFHGMCHTTINHINHHGFNRSYAGKNAAMYGKGTYFAVAASYSASNTYSRPDPQGQKYVFLCRVLTGDFTTGRQGMIVPPAKNTTSAQLYDSVTDNPLGPSMFVVFNDIQAYPEYLITFR
ncbi:protein mono-ADP-ribosyltransferase PARP14-like isoform X1 [Salvelinus fontinalis]|uniref:protein mono-ADP-ribosyltransferase PARP14-like isoform X1 n=1 Tax=Salvelinus fontinalis TaxID=8038 RepID=UPI002484EA97|nr:protein mono-ADP-ribosyltransferase PARP14-like isoform X1 [Salvelinus fontinalis]